jgi:hypothetical protein
MALAEADEEFIPGSDTDTTPTQNLQPKQEVATF